MNIEYDTAGPPRHPRALAGTPSGPSALINRIQKAPLIERLGRAETQAKASLVKNTRISATRGRGGPPPARRAKALPKSAEQLDSELDAFIRDGPKAPGEGVPSSTKPPQNVGQTDGDVDMAA